MNIYVVVDAQNDFITGPLGSEDAVKAAKEIERCLREVVTKDDLVYFTRDTHTEDYLNTLEGSKLPVPHCLFRTPGWRVQEDLTRACPVEPMFVNKVTFGEKHLAESIWRNVCSKKVDKIIFMGFCTDICVVSNALMVKAYVPEAQIQVYANCCAGTSKERHMAALEVLDSCQIEVLEVF